MTKNEFLQLFELNEIYEKYKNNDFVDVAYFEPYYLKDFLITVGKR